MTVITPVGGFIGKRPDGAAYRTGVWKQNEVYELKVDGLWHEPLYPDLAPYAINESGHILVGVYNPGRSDLVGHTQTTTSYVRPRTKYTSGGLCFDNTRWSYVYTQAVTNNYDWRFTFRYYDDPNGNNAFGGLPVPYANLKMISAGNSCYNMSSFRMDHAPVGNNSPGSQYYRIMWHDEYSGCNMTNTDYNFFGTLGTDFQYHTATAGTIPSASRRPFGAAVTYSYTNAGNTQTYEITETNRPVSMWLIPPP